MSHYESKPFVYKWTEISTGKWYIGAHFSQGCHPDDGYICSSRIVLPLITNKPEDWTREIIEVCDSPQTAKRRETEILCEMDAAADPMSYNQSNSDGKFSRSGPHSPDTIEKMRHKKRGSKNPMFGKTGGMKGKKHKEESKLKTSAKLKGRKLDPECISKIVEALQGLTWINNGIESKRVDLTLNKLPEGWGLGMLPEHAEKLAETRKGERHWNYGKSHNDETRKRISQSLIGRKNSPEQKLRKKLGNAKRAKIICDGCNRAYLACHKRHHLSCTSIINDIKKED